MIDGRPNNILLSAWFLTDEGIEERDPYEYARFVLCHQIPGDAIWGSPYHQIGMAAFASSLNNPGLVYLEYQWGNLLGRGFWGDIGSSSNLVIKDQTWVA